MKKLPHPLVSLIPLATLIILISLSIWIFGNDALLGSSQISLLFGTALCIAISVGFYKYPWKAFEEEIINTIGNSAIAIVILLLIGMLSASWMISGIVPTLVYYGIQIMSPKFFLVMTCLICALVSVMTGSSWTTIATIGVALMGIGEALGISVAWTAGAIISGAYFGDKISPLSDTTILASASVGTELFTHIRYMLFTTIPSFTISLVIFLIAGLLMSGMGETHIHEYTTHLASTFNISLWTLVIPLLTAILIAKGIPSLVTLFASSIMCAICMVILQPDILHTIAGDHNDLSLLKGIIIMFSQSTSLETGSKAVNDLVSTGGMSGMLNTIWLIICAMIFGAVMVASKMLQSITMTILQFVKNTVGLVSSTIGTGLLMNIATGDQFLSIIITANMYKDAYKNMGLEKRLLSRTTEDGVTVTSVLIPWNTCGLTQSTVLGVSTLTYLPFCFFNYISPLMSIIVASFGWKIYHTNKKMTKKDDVLQSF
ncbi:MAG TPA: sodium:proton antiporter [Prevotellaceae bacterium]|nr:sodium:proton antiporter [Prevotellaceae bacterium]